MNDIDPKKRTPFGSMLTAFRYHKQQAIEKLKAGLLKKHKLDNPKDKDKFRFEETSTTKDGATTVTVELWQRIDRETVKISTSVDVETLKTRGGRQMAINQREPKPIPVLKGQITIFDILKEKR